MCTNRYTPTTLSTNVNSILNKLDLALQEQAVKATIPQEQARPLPTPATTAPEPTPIKDTQKVGIELTAEAIQAMLRKGEDFQDKMDRCRTTCNDSPPVEGGPFIGSKDPRSFAEFSQLVRQHNMYLYGDAVTRYFFLLRNLSDSVHNSTIFGLQYGDAEDTPLMTSVSDFQNQLDKVWGYLSNEFAKSSGLFDHYKAIRQLRLVPDGDFDVHLSRFTTLIRAVQREKGSIDDRETAAHWYNSLSDGGRRDIDRAPAEEVKSFAKMRERSRGFYRSLGADKANGNPTKPVTTHMATTSPASTSSDPAQGSQQPPHQRQNWSRPKASSFWDATAKCPAEDTSDGSVFSLDFLRKFRCQRCLSHEHSTGSCKLPKMAFHSLRCPQCGTHHGALRFPDSHCRDSICYRCGKRGHMSRACPEEAPQKANGNSSQFNSVQVTESKDAGLPMINLSVSTPSTPPSPQSSLQVEALLDSGAEQALCTEAEFNRWCAAGLALSLLPDPRTVIFGDHANQTTATGKVAISAHLDDKTAVDIDVLVVRSLNYPFIVPTAILRLTGGAVWIIYPDLSQQDRIIVGPECKELFASTMDPRADNGAGTVSPFVSCHNLSTISTSTPPCPDLFINVNNVKCAPVEDLPVMLVEDDEAPDGRCCIKIPWKDPSTRPPPNFKAAYAKDCAITRRLNEQQKLLYKEAIDSLVRDGIVEELSEPLCIHYVTALPVFRADKPTQPCRVCLDAREFNRYIDITAMSGNGEGSLWYYLLAWRTTPWYECADLKQAFLKVALDHPNDTIYTGAVALGRILRFRRMPFGFGHSPHGLRSTMNWHRRQWDEEAGHSLHGDSIGSALSLALLPPAPAFALDGPVDVMSGAEGCALVGFEPAHDGHLHDGEPVGPTDPLEEFQLDGHLPATPVDLPSTPPVPREIDLVVYVDDLCHRGNSPGQVRQQAEFVKFKLRRHGADISEPKVFNNFSPCPVGTLRYVLGYMVDLGMDTIAFRYGTTEKDMDVPTTITKRDAIGIINRYYDPLGLFYEGLVFARFLAREIGSNATAWDSICSQEFRNALATWLSTAALQDAIPRNVQPLQGLYVFCDASIDAYCVDVRDGSAAHARLLGRFWLFPAKNKQTIVQKELIALSSAVEAVKKIDQVLKDFPPRPSRYMILTDSAINLHRLRKTDSAKAKLGRFEQRRLKAIEDTIWTLRKDGVQISVRHVRGECNPADKGTRSPHLGDLHSPLPPSTIREGLLTSPVTFCYPAPPQEAPQGSSPLEDDSIYLGNYVVLNNSEEDDNEHEVTTDDLLNDQATNPKIDDFKNSPYYEVLPNGLVARIAAIDVDPEDDTKTYPRHQIVVHDHGLQKKLVTKAHCVGHRGRVGTLKLLKQRYFWHGMARDCRRHVDACKHCQYARADRVQRQSMGAVPWPGAAGCLRVCAVDLTGPYNTLFHHGNDDPDEQNYGVVIIDLATNYLRATTTKSKLSSEVIRKLEALFHTTDWPQVLLIAQDSSLVSAAFRYFCDRHSICLKVLPRDSPALAGASERPHKDLHDYIHKCVQLDDPDHADCSSWTCSFFRAVRAWNVTPFTTDDDLSPHSLCWYTNPRIPELDPREDVLLGEKYHESLPPEAPLFDDSNEFFGEMKERQATKWRRWKAIWCDLREKVRMTTLSRRKLFELKTGQKVLLWTRKPGKFIGWNWEGPYPVVETVGSVTTILRNDIPFKAATTNLKPYFEDDDTEAESDDDNEGHQSASPAVPHSPLPGDGDREASPLINQDSEREEDDDEEEGHQYTQDELKKYEIGSIRVFIDVHHRYFPFTAIAGYIVNRNEDCVTIIPFVDDANRLIEADRLVDEPAVLSSETIDVPRYALRDIACLKYRVPPTRNMLRLLREATAGGV